MRKNSIKNTRINMEVQRELSEIIHGGNQGSKDSSHDQRGFRGGYTRP